MALLVFKTIRTGFPSAKIFVYGNVLDPEQAHEVEHTAIQCSCTFNLIALTSHGEWIERLVSSERHPFWICDTDIVFHKNIEQETFPIDALFAGRHEPEFAEPWTKTIHMARLHPGLMWFNPAQLRSAIRGWPEQHEFFDSVDSNLFGWHWVPEKDKPLRFYDTCAGLYHALNGTPFTNAQNESFSHLFCGSYSHLAKNDLNLARLHDSVFSSPEASRGLWNRQQEWYEQQTTA